MHEEAEPDHQTTPDSAVMPLFDGLVADLKQLRRKGLVNLRSLTLPALEQAVRAAGALPDPTQQVDAPMIEYLIRIAWSEMNDSLGHETFGLLMGIPDEYRLDTPGKLRKEAAEHWGVSHNHFRNSIEPKLMGVVAENILRRCHDYQRDHAPSQTEGQGQALGTVVSPLIEPTTAVSYPPDVVADPAASTFEPSPAPPSAPPPPPAGNQLIPEHLMAKLGTIGETIFTGTATYVDVSEYYLPAFLEASTPTDGAAWDNFAHHWIHELSTGATRYGGWAEAGAFYVAKDFVKPYDWQKPQLQQILDRALTFLVEIDTNRHLIPMFAVPRWDEIRQQRS